MKTEELKKWIKDNLILDLDRDWEGNSVTIGLGLKGDTRTAYDGRVIQDIFSDVRINIPDED